MPPKKNSKTKIPKKPIPEDFELSDEEPTTIKLDEDQKLTSKNIVFECPLCKGKLQMRNEIEINPKGSNVNVPPVVSKSARMIKK